MYVLLQVNYTLHDIYTDEVVCYEGEYKLQETTKIAKIAPDSRFNQYVFWYNVDDDIVYNDVI